MTVMTPTKCLVCDVPTVLLAVTGCSSVYDDTCPHRATSQGAAPSHLDVAVSQQEGNE
jgi:hypothetical protein